MRKLAIDLFAGRGGWSRGLKESGWSEIVGFDIEQMGYSYGQLVLQDVLTIHGSQFRNADLIVASPPCQKYSYMAMPWTRAKKLAAWYREDPARIVELNALFDACFRIQREASEAAGRHIPMVVENVKGAQPWVGSARWHYGSFYLWGDVPALMPLGGKAKRPGQKISDGFNNWPRDENGNYVIADGTTTVRRDNAKERRRELVRSGAQHNERTHSKNPAHEGVKQGGNWWHDPNSMTCRFSSRSAARKEASARIAMIPFALARHIGEVYLP